MLPLLTRARGRWNGDLQPSVNSIKGKYEGITIQNNVNALRPGALTQVDSTVLLSEADIAGYAAAQAQGKNTVTKSCNEPPRCPLIYAHWWRHRSQ